jgi:hypothetical protein
MQRNDARKKPPLKLNQRHRMVGTAVVMQLLLLRLKHRQRSDVPWPRPRRPLDRCVQRHSKLLAPCILRCALPLVLRLLLARGVGLGLRAGASRCICNPWSSCWTASNISNSLAFHIVARHHPALWHARITMRPSCNNINSTTSCSSRRRPCLIDLQFILQCNVVVVRPSHHSPTSLRSSNNLCRHLRNRLRVWPSTGLVDALVLARPLLVCLCLFPRPFK